MQAQGYKIIFEGKVAAGIDVETAKGNMQRLFKTNDATVERLFSGKRVILKKNVPSEKIDRYLDALTQAGIVFVTDPEIDDEQPKLELEFEDGEPQTGKGARSDPDVQAAEAVDQPIVDPDTTDMTNVDLTVQTAQGATVVPGERLPVNPYAPPEQDPAINQQVFCRSCGGKIYEYDVVCPHCGAGQTVGKPKSKVVAGLLAIFLGFLGAHRFYLGQWVGLIYVLFGAVAWLVALVEGIVFLATPQERWDQKYSNVTGGGAAMVIVAALAFLFISGIVAAIAIPAYADYSHRAAVARAEQELRPTLDAIEAFAEREGYLPVDGREAGIRSPVSTERIKSAVVSDNGTLLAVLSGAAGDPLADQTILWVPSLENGSVRWDCSGGTLVAQFRPAKCRRGEYSGQQSVSSTQWVAAEDGSSKILLPVSWQPMPELTEVASVEYGNPYREQYAVVITEPKADFADDVDLFAYNDLVLEQNYRPVLANLSVKLLGEVEVNGMKGIKYELRGEIDNVKIVYLHTALEGADHFHQVLFWTLPTQWRANRKTFETALAKFSECPRGCKVN